MEEDVLQGGFQHGGIGLRELMDLPVPGLFSGFGVEGFRVSKAGGGGTQGLGRATRPAQSQN